MERDVAGFPIEFSLHILLEYNALVTRPTSVKLMHHRHGLCLRKVDWLSDHGAHR